MPPLSVLMEMAFLLQINASPIEVNFNADLNEKPENIYSIYYPTIAHRYDNIKVVELHFFALVFSSHSTMLSGYSEFPNNHFFIKFSLFKNIRNLLQIYNKFRINHQSRLRK